MGVLTVQKDNMGTGHILRADGKVVGLLEDCANAYLTIEAGNAEVPFAEAVKRKKGASIHFRQKGLGSYDLVARTKKDGIPMTPAIKLITSGDILLPSDISDLIGQISSIAPDRDAGHKPGLNR